MSKVKIAVGVMVAFFALSGVQAKEAITIASWGGLFQQAQRKAWFTPIEKSQDITIKEDTTSGIADVRTQVASGKPTWDIVEQGNQSCPIMQRDGLLEKLDPSIVDTSGIPDEMKSDYWVADVVYGVVIAWNNDTVKGEKPQSWADFWNVEKFPGQRSLRRSPLYNLAAALMADGVAPGDVYKVLNTPSGIDRAFRKLEEIKPHVSAWWGSGSQSVQLMKNDAADMIGIWNGRIQDLAKDDKRFGMTWKQQILVFDCLAVLKGTKHKEAAMKALAAMIKPKAQARLSTLINYAPANLKAYDTGIIDAETAARLPNSPQNAKSSLILDPNWWSRHYDALSLRFDQMLQQ